MLLIYVLAVAWFIRASLERNAFNRLAVARELGIHKTTLFRRIKKLGIILPDKDGRSLRTHFHFPFEFVISAKLGCVSLLTS